MSGEEGLPPGFPVFTYIARLPDDAAAKAQQVAFQNARKDAQATAEAAGLKLGKLRSVVASIIELSEREDYMLSRLYGLYGGQMGRGEKEKESPILREVSFGVHAVVAYDIPE
jgi:hypothetical protein